eukprot:TRINITY_DN19079_c0_g1_i2.p1 TRINITY_DN19079_c0_g1~~TRINITY_DN19079_c0_g1_i2.p1  ORF type:complete len:352 (+),score=72.78 TRINITY_DN19079_c0_g1_i2:446-1501(+)
MQDSAEMHSYGLKPFTTHGEPASLEEAAERGPYTLVNTFLFDAGSPLYGGVSTIFSLEAARKSALLSAIDTGFYQSMCAVPTMRSAATAKGQLLGKTLKAKVGGNPFATHHNCSAYTPLEQLGTMEHFNHLLLINEQFWRDDGLMVRRFARLEGPWGNARIDPGDLLHYFEAVPAATLQYPKDVRMLIGSYPEHFGAESGQKLQQWAASRGWILAWSLGLNLGENVDIGMAFDALSSGVHFYSNNRLLDPLVASKSSAAASLQQLSAEVDSAFQRHWAEMQALRDMNKSISNVTFAERWHGLSDELRELKMEPLRAGNCSQELASRECVGTTGGRCVCYAEAETTGMAVIV